MSLQLLVIAGPDKGRAFTLQAGPDLMLGRSAQAYYQLNAAILDGLLRRSGPLVRAL